MCSIQRTERYGFNMELLAECVLRTRDRRKSQIMSRANCGDFLIRRISNGASKGVINGSCCQKDAPSSKATWIRKTP